MSKFKVVVATRVSQDEFFEKTATGRSLRLFALPFFEVCLFANNSMGLPQLYNAAVVDCVNEPCVLVFMHDDIHILDYHWIDNVLAGLQEFQILGVAGNKSRVPRQPSWAFVDDKYSWDKPENLSGIVAHGKSFPPKQLDRFGPTRQRVKLLDGLFLAAYSRTFTENGLHFDERFDFHFYDMDLCRQAEQKNVTCGTWPLALMHESEGNFESEAWKKSRRLYFDKWGD